MTTKKQPIPGQMSLETVAEITPMRADLERKRAIGSMFKPSDYGFKLEDLGAASHEHMALTEADNLREALYGPGKNSVNGLVLNDDEFDTIVRYPKAFGQHAERQARKKRRLDHNLERREQKTSRAPGHAFDEKIEPLSTALAGIKNEAQWLNELARSLKHPGYAHNKNIDMQLMLRSVFEFSFRNLLDVAAMRQGWTTAEVAMADKALVRRLTTGEQKLRVAKLIEITHLAKQYNRAREALFANRLNIARRVGSAALTAPSA